MTHQNQFGHFGNYMLVSVELPLLKKCVIYNALYLMYLFLKTLVLMYF